MSLRFTFFSLFVFCLSSSLANDYQTLEGDFRLAGQIRYGDVEQGNSHLYIRLTGSSARALYQSLPATEKLDGCSTLLAKKSGNISCYKGASVSDNYCIFAIDTENNKVVIGETC